MLKQYKWLSGWWNMTWLLADALIHWGFWMEKWNSDCGAKREGTKQVHYPQATVIFERWHRPTMYAIWIQCNSSFYGMTDMPALEITKRKVCFKLHAFQNLFFAPHQNRQQDCFQWAHMHAEKGDTFSSWAHIICKCKLYYFIHFWNGATLLSTCDELVCQFLKGRLHNRYTKIREIIQTSSSI